LLIRISLLLAFSSVLVLVIADLCLRLGFQSLSFEVLLLGAAALLSAFVGLMIKGLSALIKACVTAIGDYFSTQQRCQRELLFNQAKHDQTARLFMFKAEQMRFWTRQNIKRLLHHNQQQHIRSLAKALEKDLLSQKKQMNRATFKQLQLEIVSSRKRHDIEALLKLQHKIASPDWL